MCFSSDGLPCQEFPFDPDGTVLTGELRIMVRDRADSEFPRWNEYTFTEDLALAGEFDRAFSFDEKRRRIVFGDNENGEAPPVGTDNILVISCSLTKGAAGNLAAGNLHEITGAEVSCRGGAASELAAAGAPGDHFGGSAALPGGAFRLPEGGFRGGLPKSGAANAGAARGGRQGNSVL